MGILLILGQSYEDFGPSAPDWKQFRHDFRRTGRTALVGNCGSMSRLYDRVHGGLDLSLISVDVNHDGDYDIITAEINYGVKATDGNSGANLWLRDFPDQFRTPIASVAASRNNRKIYAHSYSYFRVLNMSGNILYSQTKSSRRGESPLVADIEPDGCPEVFVYMSGYAYSIRGCASTFLYNWRTSLPSPSHAAAMGDIDGNGDWEILFPLTNGRIYVLNAEDGSFHSSFYAYIPSTPETYPDYTVAVEDLDGDGRDEVVVPRRSAVRVYEYGSSWTQVWYRSLTNSSTVALGDKNGDGRSDVWVVSGNELRVYRGYDGAYLGGTSSLGARASYPPTLLDLNNDGHLDAVVMYGNYRLRLVNGVTMNVITTLGTTPYGITSEVVPLKLSPTSLGFSVGDHSCHISTWGYCTLAAADDDLSTSENRDEIKEEIRLSGRTLFVSGRDGSSVEIYNLTGNRVFHGTIKGSSLRVDLSHLPKGVYLVRTPIRLTKVVLR